MTSSEVILGDANILKVSIKLKRDFTPLVLNTFLPTFILTVINQLTNYFIGYEMFEGIIAINATVLMTLASIFISVFNSMPQSTYIKMMDIWMIVTFVYPFIIIFVHTIVHVLHKGGKQKRESNKIKYLLKLSQFLLPLLFLAFSLIYWIVGISMYVN